MPSVSHSRKPKPEPLPLKDLQAKLWATPYSDLRAAWREASISNGDADLCLVDRYFLLTQILKRPDALHPWVYARCREVEAAPDGHLDVWARSHFKSTIITTAGAIQEVLRDPDITIAIFSHTKPIAKAFLAQIKRELESNVDLLELFPEVLWADPKKDAPMWSLDGGLIVRREANTKEATVEAHGLVDGQPTSRHFKLRIYDDVVVPESVSTPEQISKTTEAWELSQNLGMEGGREQMAGTRYHHADTYFSVMERGAAKPRIHPCTDNGQLDGNPVLWTRKHFEEQKLKQSDAVFSCQNLCSPLAGKSRMFDVADLMRYEARPETLMVYILVDPARSTKKDSAHTAMVVLGLDYAGNKYLLDGRDHKMALQDRWAQMRNLYVRWRREPGIVGVNVGYERFGAIADLDYFEERMQLERLRFDITALEWPREGPGSKVDRVQRLTPDLKLHRLYLPHPTDPERLTSLQRRMDDSGYGYRISQRIRALDEDKQLYDLTERLTMQISYFPFGDRVDLVDALSRVYDMEPAPPTPPAQECDLEPDVV